MFSTKVNSGQGVARACALLIAGMLFSSAAAAEIRTYRWTDESGTVVYSQTPPPPGIDAKLIGAPPPPAESPDVARERLEKQIDKLEADRDERRESRQKAAEQKAHAGKVAGNCAAAKQNLTLYEDAPPNRLYKDDTGVHRRFTPEERDAKIKAAREAIDKYCK